MADTEEVNRYLLGQLSVSERRQFELQLEQSAALRTLVREMETGLVALATSAPHQEAPRVAWTNIEAAVAQQARWRAWRSLVRLKWLANGWAIAGGLAVLMAVQSFWRSPVTNPPIAPLALVKTAPQVSVVPKLNLETNGFATGFNPARTNSFAETELRQKIFRLENQLAQFTHPVASAATGTTQVVNAKSLELFPLNTRAALGRSRLSPKLQQAVLLAVAHQLGWGKTPPTLGATDLAPAGSPEVDFVDLPSGASTANPVNAAAAEIASTSDTAGLADTSGVAILPWEENLVAVIDPSTLPPDPPPLNIWSVDAEGNPSVVGTVSVGNNPVVITIGGANAQNNPQYFITVGASTNIIGHFPPGP